MGSIKTVNIGGITIGGDAPVRVESMLKTPLMDIEGCAAEIENLAAEGCELVRVALPDISFLNNLRKIITSSKVPVMADIHFDHRLAIAAIDSGCRAIRINPGNMSNEAGIIEVIKLAKEAGTVIRIGANGGSLNNAQIEQAKGDRSAALILAVEEQLRTLIDNGFDSDIIVSAKSSSIPETLRANAVLSQRYPFPIHIGITEAGSGIQGTVKGSSGIAIMLAQGIGDTIRVSLTAPGIEEVRTGYHILRSLEIRRRGYNLISCPTCGRKRVDVLKLSAMVAELLPPDIRDGTTIAVMGCEVNGPREAAGADLGIAGTPEGFIIFRKGLPICLDKIENLKERLLEALKNI